VVERTELELLDWLGEIEVPADDLVIDDLVWLEDVGSAEMGLAVLLE
jgi:hypothetical protein